MKTTSLVLFVLPLFLCRSTGAASSATHVAFGGAEAPSTIYYYDLTYTAGLSRQDAFEHMHLAAALSGLANRNGPLLYTTLTSADAEWKAYLSSAGQWLNTSTFLNLPNVTTLVKTLASVYSGVVLYDPKVFATSNLASTASGVFSLLPVCYRPEDPSSLYSVLVESGPRLKVVMNLVGMFNGSRTGSAKCDAYLWAKEKFLDTKLCDGSFLAYYVDYFATTNTASSDYTLTKVSNHDFFIAHRSFFFDLDVWGDEAPNDDPSQPVGTDRNTLLEILMAAYNQTGGSKMIHIGGFTPWFFKYVGTHSQHQHEGVATEWESVKVFTAYNAYVDADACCIGAMANAALFQHFPLPSSMVQNPVPTIQELQEKGYIDSSGHVVTHNYCMFYAGDYDLAAWLYSQLKGRWDDPNRGKVPIGWAIDPELSMRFPVIFPYLYSTRTASDFFIAGDSGAGYLNPTQLIPPRQVSNITQSAADLWVNYNKPLYQKFDMQFTGFVIQGSSGLMTSAAEDMYSQFSPLGIVLTPDVDPDQSNLHRYGSMPVFHHMSDLPGGDVSKAVDVVTSFASPYTKFYMFRTILQTATFHYQVATDVQQKAPEMVFVDPYTLSVLAQVYLNTTVLERG